jgi:ATP-dependent Clp protease ATP-binding subunit ClpA
MLERTMQWANRLNAESVEPEHLLLGILDDEQSMALVALKDIGVAGESVKAKLVEQLKLTPEQLKESVDEKKDEPKPPSQATNDF